MRVAKHLAACAALAGAASAVTVPRFNPVVGRGSSRYQSKTLDEYEFVVVGAGPGGGTLAANLARGGHKVLLIEAGDDHGEELVQTIPAMNLASTEDDTLAWDFFVHKYEDLEKEKRDSKMTYRLADGSVWTSYNATPGAPVPDSAEPLGILYPRAAGLGGCSRHNALLSLQNGDNDWDDLADIMGDDSWRHGNMRQYLQRIENVAYQPHSPDAGTQGWFHIQVTSLLTAATDLKIVSVLLGACAAFGKGIVGEVVATAEYLASVLLSDINAPGQLLVPEVYQVPLAMRPDSARGGAYDIIVQTATAANPDGSRMYHLDIMLNTLVTKVVFDTAGHAPRATGVEYMTGTALYRADRRSAHAKVEGTGSVSATKEVIVSGGAYNTPQILKLSGVGPREELERFGIPVVLDAPGVGTNLQDRYEETVVSKTPEPFVLTAPCKWTPTMDDPCTATWVEGDSQTAKGPYASNGIAIAIVRNSSTAAHGIPDVMVLGGPANFTGYYPGWGEATVRDAQHWAWIILKARNRNRAGTVTLRSADPRDTPVINFNKFTTGADEDLTAIAEGFAFARSIMDAVTPLPALADGSLQELAEGAFAEVWPGRDVQGDALKQFVRDETWGHHASCSCPMGPADDPMSVLDTDLNVRGVDGLRVVDASVFPLIPGFFPILTLHQVVEKVSDVIIAQYKSE